MMDLHLIDLEDVHVEPMVDEGHQDPPPPPDQENPPQRDPPPTPNTQTDPHPRPGPGPMRRRRRGRGRGRGWRRWGRGQGKVGEMYFSDNVSLTNKLSNCTIKYVYCEPIISKNLISIVGNDAVQL